MPGQFEVSFKGLRPDGDCRWKGIFQFTPPPRPPGILPTAANWWANQLGIASVGATEFELCTIDLSESLCVEKCEPRPIDASDTTTWSAGSITEYVCAIGRLPDLEVGDCVRVRYLLKVWRVRLGVTPIDATVSGHTGGIVLPGQINMTAGQVPHLTKRVTIELCCVDDDEDDAHAAPGDVEQPEELQGEEVADDCHIECKLIRPRRAL